ncbi:hypothetical protein AVDCRST_MAG94-3443 [uncultured Leptolyngbya sp.]|uniref:Uncharacterized protein n=1 Tax=uncultured Leptolyngbya sp. TaxID=332963 RepID=A0A6J4MMG7_9CYAN|nr:hypothetical protein AVDCRST_MAG94-3443 [uncultured Leptolyngbya sp.]
MALSGQRRSLSGSRHGSSHRQLTCLTAKIANASRAKRLAKRTIVIECAVASRAATQAQLATTLVGNG